MTTTTLPITFTPTGPAMVGAKRIRTIGHTVEVGGFTWDVFQGGGDEWYEPCKRCDLGHGVIPHYAHVLNGICFKCGGAGVTRLGSRSAVERKLRERARARLSKATVMARKAEQEEAALDAWSLAQPELAGHLAQIRASGERDGMLFDLAMNAARRPLTPKQVELATRLLAERAYAEAYADAPPVTIGTIGEKITVTGPIAVRYYLPAERYDRSSAYLIILNVPAGDSYAPCKIVTSAQWAFDAEVGDEATYTGYVAQHTTYRDAAQTILKGRKPKS